MHWTDKFASAGDVCYQSDDGIILCADSLQAMPKIPMQSVDMVMLDPAWGYYCTPVPRTWVGLQYPVTRDEDILRVALLCARRLKEDRHLYMWTTSPRQMEQSRVAMLLCAFSTLAYKSSLVWHKKKGMGLGHYFRIDTETALLFSNGKRLGLRHDISNYIPGDLSDHSHKPVPALEAMISLSTEPGEIVLDPFLHTGQTAIVAKSMGRRFVGIEIVPKFAQAAGEAVSQELLFTGE